MTHIEDVDGERRATVELAVTLADGTTTLTGDAVVAVYLKGTVTPGNSGAQGRDRFGLRPRHRA